MLARSLHERTIEGLFGSSEIRSELQKYLLNLDYDSDALGARCIDALERTLEQDHRREFRRSDIQRVVSGVGTFLSSPSLPVLDELFDRLMVRNGDMLQYREDSVQGFARLAAGVDPTLIAGWHLACWLDQSVRPSTNDVRRIVEAQVPMFAPAASNRSFAEGHVHLGGITFDGLVLADQLLFDRNVRDKKEHLTVRRLQRVLRVLLESTISRSSDNTPDGTTDLRIRLRQAVEPESFDTDRSTHLPLDWQTVANACIVTRNVDSQWLVFHLANAIDADLISQAWLWLVIYLWSLFRAPGALLCERAAVCYLINGLMGLRRKIIMDGQGLTRFADDYYSAPLRKPRNARANSVDRIRRLLASQSDLAEIKIGTDAFGPSIAQQVAEALVASAEIQSPDLPVVRANGFDLSLDPRTHLYVGHLNRWHFCAHMSRSNPKRLTRNRYQQLQWARMKELRRALERQAGWNVDTFLHGRINENVALHPARWLRGLDVAGDENVGRIELFAPMLRWMRSGMLTRPDGERPAGGFHFSIHAGEDYAHPLSGMRHIDETVRFCDMRSGDRLGHALAIGIDLKVWTDRHGDMVLPVDEHLDNLVWAWHYACELSGKLPLAAQILPRLERRIARFAREVPWLSGGKGQSAGPLLHSAPDRSFVDRPIITRDTGVTPDTLYRAWQLRRNCATTMRENIPVAIQDDLLDQAVPDFARLKAAWETSNDGTPESIYLARESAFSLTPKGKVRDVLVRVAAKDNTDLSLRLERDSTAIDGEFLYDYETAEDLDFATAIQDHLLHNFDRMGLIIETNPTSNVYIARLNSYSEHPIFRWSPPNDRSLEKGERYNRFGLRSGPIQVLVNTDDPGIMPTTLRTEYALLLEASVDLGYSRTTSEMWLERIRQAGIDQFYRNHLQVFPGL
ncbi:hypothetical protein SAMN05443245_4199 [Paraburkholderia fungorum]|uniref:Adenosine deaminase n=1 Tax=Paraburkholderia fungorum TaxID=134537 RepID=A0A1H1HR18_9BURK|nr:antiviral RADAR system adenosine deaminase RdrB [Paraburkholderia fungorum]SDR27921.1 hypothetical protein SAMN05443245_4199 [Paraburkholderia fungorum]